MRYLILFVSLMLAANALAEEKPASAAKELNKSSAQLMGADLPDAADAKEKPNKAKARAQDYNSSRSNTTAAREDKEGELEQDSEDERDTVVRKKPG